MYVEFYFAHLVS